MKAWWDSLQARERLLVQMAAVLGALLLLWLLVWRPLARAEAELTLGIETLSTEVAEATQATRAILAGRNAGLIAAAPLVPHGGPSLMALTDSSARDAGLSSALKRLQPEGENQVKLEFEAADFDALVGWLERLDRQDGVVVTEWSVDRALAPGVVNARMTLENVR